MSKPNLFHTQFEYNTKLMKIKVALPIIAVFLILGSIGIWKHDLLLKPIWNYLVVNERPRPSDVIIVLGSGSDRVEEGVRLYQQGYAPKLILSGDSSHEMEMQAISLGVPENALISETKSGTTFGNAYYSAKIMRAQDFHSAIVVTSAYHTRRSSIIFSLFFKSWKLTVCAAPYNGSISNNWWKYKQTIYYVITEYLKLVYLYLVEIPGSETIYFLILIIAFLHHLIY